MNKNNDTNDTIRGEVVATCLSEEKGTPKRDVGSVDLIEGHGIRGDAHAGDWHRQVSLLSYDKVEDFRKKGATAPDGAFGENLLVRGIDFRALPVGTRLTCGDVLLEITQIGKECHNGCAIFEQMGDCIMPREGVFAIVLKGGPVRAGDEISVSRIGPERSGDGFRVAIITSSDKGYAGEREDVSGQVVRELVEGEGYSVVHYVVLPDEFEQLKEEMERICDRGVADLLITTGGTGFSPRDCTPEATLAVGEREAPGIAEAMRQGSLNVTKRAMLSRAVSVIRGATLIVNLPGSPKSVRENLEFVLPVLGHGLQMLTGQGGECARQRG
jgi:molybdenum cofactor synthesis domain-containing protein